MKRKLEKENFLEEKQRVIFKGLKRERMFLSEVSQLLKSETGKSGERGNKNERKWRG